MNLTLFWFLFVAIQSLCLAIAYRASQKHISTADYYLASRRMNFFPLLMTFVATQVGGGLILGSAEEAYRIGWKIIFYPLGAISGFLLLGTFLGKRLAELPVSTVAQIFEYSYGSKGLKRIASLLSILTLFMITVAQVLASQKFLSALQLNHSAWFYAFWTVVFIYTMWGGLGGIAGIDVVQASFFLIVFGASLAAVILGDFATPITATSFSIESSLDSSTWIAWFLMPCLFMLIEQDMAQRCFSARSPAIMKRAALGSAVIVFLVCIVPIAFGLVGQSNQIDVPFGQSVFMTLVQSMTSPTMSAAVACAVMMAIISTAVSLIHSISSNLTQDFQMDFVNPSRRLFFSRAVTLGVGFAALFVSTYFDNIVGVLIQSYELSVVCLFIPVLMSLLKKQNGPMPAAFAIGFGAASFVLFRVIEVPFAREVLELTASGVGFAVGQQCWSMRRR